MRRAYLAFTVSTRNLGRASGSLDIAELNLLAELLTDSYGYQCRVRDLSNLSSKAFADDLSTWLAPSDSPLLLLDCCVVEFERNGERQLHIATGQSVPGRPGSMVNFGTLRIPSDTAVILRAHVRASGARSRVTDGDTVGDLSRSARFALVGLADCDEMVSVWRPFWRAAAEAAFGSGSWAIDPTGSLDVVPIYPVYRPAVLPEYILNDLFSDSPGSRLDALSELADIVNGIASDVPASVAESLITHLKVHDEDPGVRSEAERLTAEGGRNRYGELLRFEVIHGKLARVRGSVVLDDFAVILPGEFLIGHSAGQSFEKPEFKVSLDKYYIAKSQVTVEQYLGFVAATDYHVPTYWTSDIEIFNLLNYPVVQVSWYDAVAYCEWLGSELYESGEIARPWSVRLPTEVEWEAACRGPRGLLHPWGNEFDPSRCNTAAGGSGVVLPVGSHSPEGDTPSGICDLIGNVWEWTLSIWGPGGRTPSELYPIGNTNNSAIEAAPGSVRRVVRGGAYYYFDECSNGYTRNRFFPSDSHSAGGFRPVISRA